MRTAFVVSNLTYPPLEGLHQQSLLTLQMLRSFVPDVHLLGFVKDLAALDEAALARDTGLRFAAPPITTRLPDIVLGLANRLLPLAMRGARVATLARSLADYDIVHLENVGAVGLSRRAIDHRSILAVIDPGTLRWARLALSARTIRERWTARLKRLLHLLLERSTFRPGMTVHVVSREDGEYLKARYPDCRIAAIPVSLPALSERPAPLRPEASPELLVFVDLRQPHLRKSFLWFCSEVLARCVTARAARLTVLGRAPADAELSAAVAGLDAGFLTWVDDYQAVLANATVIVVPDLVGTGLKNRALQGMAAGRPVVGTCVAFEGIDATPDRDAIVSDDPTKMARKLDALLSSRERCAEMGAFARAKVVEQFSIRANIDRWRSLYDGLAAGEDVGSHVT